MWTGLPHRMVTSSQTSHITAWSSKCLSVAAKKAEVAWPLWPSLTSHNSITLVIFFWLTLSQAHPKSRGGAIEPTSQMELAAMFQNHHEADCCTIPTFTFIQVFNITWTLTQYFSIRISGIRSMLGIQRKIREWKVRSKTLVCLFSLSNSFLSFLRVYKGPSDPLLYCFLPK